MKAHTLKVTVVEGSRESLSLSHWRTTSRSLRRLEEKTTLPVNWEDRLQQVKVMINSKSKTYDTAYGPKGKYWLLKSP